MKRLTIKNRLFIAIVAILVSSYAFLFFSSLISIKTFTEDEIVKDLQAALKYAQSQFKARPETVMEALKLPISSLPVQKWFAERDVATLREAASRWNRSLDFLEIVTLVDAQQKIVARNNVRSDKSFLQGYLLKSAFERRQPFITTELVSHEEYCREVRPEVCQALSDNRDVLVQLVILPVVDRDGNVLGAVVAGDDVNKDPHLPYQQQMVFGKTVEMLITQKEERIASTMPANSALSQSLDVRVVQSLRGGFSFNGSTVLNGRDYEMIAEPINNHKGEFVGAIAVALEKGEFSTIRHENFRNLIICALFSIPLIFLLAYFTASRFTIPIRRLSDAVKRIAAGDYSSRVPESGSGDFITLYETFNRMTAALEERDAIIVRQNSELLTLNEELERRVLERTEQLKNESETNKAILKSLLDGVLVTDSGQRIIHLNSMAEKLLGKESHGMVGEPVAKLFQKLQLTELAEKIGSMPELLTADGETVLLAYREGKKLRIAISCLLDERDQHRGLLLAIRDVSREGEVDRLKSDFIATVSHELKTPLTSMKGSLQFILKKGKWLTGVEREMLDVCLRNTERLISLIGSILEISRIEAGQVSFRMKPVVLAELALYVLEEAKVMALSRNISFYNSINFDLPQAYGDYDRLHQVLFNLVANAVKFAPADSVVTLAAELQGDLLALSVSDEGKTIKPSDRELLFGKFQQFAYSDDGDVGGSGLGLAICREIITKHGGSIYYAPGVAGGNIFTFTVPVYGEKDVQG